MSLLHGDRLLEPLVRYQPDADDAAAGGGGGAAAAPVLAPEIERAAQMVSGTAGLYVASHHVDHGTNPLVAQASPHTPPHPP